MKKSFFLLLSLICCFSLFAVPTAFAAQPTKNTHFDDPTCVFAADDEIFVADAGEQFVLHVFSGDELKTTKFDKKIEKIRKSEDKLLLLVKDQIICFDRTTETQTAIKATGIKDFEIFGTDIFALLADGVCKAPLTDAMATKDLSKSGKLILPNDKIKSLACGDKKLFLLTDEKILSYDGAAYGIGDDAATASGIFCIGDDCFAFDAQTINGEEMPFEVVDVFAQDKDDVYVISKDDLSVFCYAFDGKVFDKTEFSIGSNYKTYPTNFDPIAAFDDLKLFSTVDGAYLYSAQSGAEPHDKFGYLPEGTAVMKLADIEDSAYVLTFKDGEACFGFIDPAMLVKTDIEQVSVRKATITAGQFVYSLPVKADDFKVKQNGEVLALPADQDMTAIAELSSFGSDKWLFVILDDVCGFVQEAHLKTPPPDYPTYVLRVANPPIGKSLGVYSEPTETSAVIARITDGALVKVFEEENGWARVYTEEGYGWVQAVCLAQEGTLTNSAALGLAIGIIVLLCIAFIVFWKLRMRQKDKN